MDSVASGLATSTLGGKKFKIQQSIPVGSIKKGPHAIVRSADLNDGIEIKRRFGEGSKPLFARDDIAVNQPTIDAQCSGHFGGKSHRKSLSTESSSPERYRHREKKEHLCSTSGQHRSPPRSRYSINKPSQSHDKHSYNTKLSSTKTDRYKRRDKSPSRSPSPLKKKPAGRIPYYRDEKRERDRLRRLYGHSQSRSPDQSANKKSSSPIRKRRTETPPRRYSANRERHSRHSPTRNSRRDYRSRRSPTPTRIRSSRGHDHHKHSDNDIKKGHTLDSNAVATTVTSTTPQYIPVPVAVPTDYGAYSFPPWHRLPPPSHFASYPMWPMMPHLRPHQAPFLGIPPSLPFTPIAAQYRPRVSQRYPPIRHNTSSYQPRPRKT